MNRWRLLIVVLAASLVALSLPANAQGDRLAGMMEEAQAGLVTEGELAQWLVRVLGLARFLPAAPTDLECFQILMQNGIVPKDGWQPDRPVTMGTLARVLVLSLGKQAEVENPESDESWIGYLKSEGIDFGTIGEAMENVRPLPQPVGPEAVVTKTDPLGKLARINPPDNQQGGADFSTLGRDSSRYVLREDIFVGDRNPYLEAGGLTPPNIPGLPPPVPPAIEEPIRPRPRPPMTPARP